MVLRLGGISPQGFAAPPICRSADNLHDGARFDYRFKRCGSASLFCLRSDSNDGVGAPAANTCLMAAFLLSVPEKAPRGKEKISIFNRVLNHVTVRGLCSVAHGSIVPPQLMTPLCARTGTQDSCGTECARRPLPRGELQRGENAYHLESVKELPGRKSAF
jgi:hypothetical protein